MNRQDLVFVDTETTGLDPDFHEIWEVSIGYWQADGSQTFKTWQFPIDQTLADPIALNIGHYWERRVGPAELAIFYQFADEFQTLTHGKHLVGAVVSFDEERLRRLMLREGRLPTWHYHVIDVEAMAVGYRQGVGDDIELPWNSNNLSRDMGVDPDSFDRHTAEGDVRWAIALFEACEGFR